MYAIASPGYEISAGSASVASSGLQCSVRFLAVVVVVVVTSSAASMMSLPFLAFLAASARKASLRWLWIESGSNLSWAVLGEQRFELLRSLASGLALEPTRDSFRIAQLRMEAQDFRAEQARAARRSRPGIRGRASRTSRCPRASYVSITLLEQVIGLVRVARRRQEVHPLEVHRVERSSRARTGAGRCRGSCRALALRALRR